jgi:hypothetical protein
LYESLIGTLTLNAPTGSRSARFDYLSDIGIDFDLDYDPKLQVWRPTPRLPPITIIMGESTLDPDLEAWRDGWVTGSARLPIDFDIRLETNIGPGPKMRFRLGSSAFVAMSHVYRGTMAQHQRLLQLTVQPQSITLSELLTIDAGGLYSVPITILNANVSFNAGLISGGGVTLYGSAKRLDLLALDKCEDVVDMAGLLTWSNQVFANSAHVDFTVDNGPNQTGLLRNLTLLSKGLVSLSLVIQPTGP